MINFKTEAASPADVIELCAAIGISCCLTDLRGAIANVRRGYRVRIGVIGTPSEKPQRLIFLATTGLYSRGDETICDLPKKFDSYAMIEPDKGGKASRIAFYIADTIHFMFMSDAIAGASKKAWLVPRIDGDGVRQSGAYSDAYTLEKHRTSLARFKLERARALDELRKARGVETSYEKKQRKEDEKRKRKIERKTKPSKTKIAAAAKRAKKVEDNGLRLLNAITKHAKSKRFEILKQIRRQLKPVPKMIYEAGRLPPGKESQMLLSEAATRKRIGKEMVSAIIENEKQLRDQLVSLNLPNFKFSPITNEEAEKMRVKWEREALTPAQRQRLDNAELKLAKQAAKVEAKREKEAAREALRAEKERSKLQAQLEKAKKKRESAAATRAKRDAVVSKRSKREHEKFIGSVVSETKKKNDAKRNALFADLVHDSEDTAHVVVTGKIGGVEIKGKSFSHKAGINRIDEKALKTLNRVDSPRPVSPGARRAVIDLMMAKLNEFEASSRRENTQGIGISESLITGSRVEKEWNPHIENALLRHAATVTKSGRGKVYSGVNPGGRSWSVLVTE